MQELLTKSTDMPMEPPTADEIVTTVQKIVAVIDQAEAKRTAEGFNNKNFTVGVLNCFLVVQVFGMYPEHFWLLYLIEFAYLIPVKVYKDFKAKPLNQVFYYLDYCWIMNMLGCAALVLFSFKSTFSTEVRKHVFMALVGVSCGPLFGACALLPFVALVFHSRYTMTGLFIHIFPPLLVYTFMWHTDEIREAWPNVFQLDYLDELRFFPEQGVLFLPGTAIGTIAGNTIALYMLWFIPYVCWYLLIGKDLPRKNRKGKDGKMIIPRYDTVIHSTIRPGVYTAFGKLAWGRPASVSRVHVENDDYELRDVFVYLTMHAILCYLATIVLAYLCFLDKRIHATLLVVLEVICVYRGSLRYTYWATAMYGRIVRKEFADKLKEDGTKQE